MDMEDASSIQGFQHSALSGRQSDLFDALSERDKQAANMYLGALVVLSHDDNPDRYALAAHDIRELIDKLPRLVDVPIAAQKETLKQKVIELEDVWQSTCSNTRCFHNPRWSGEIDEPLKRILEKLVGFFQWFENHYPRRRKEIASTLRGLDISTEYLPGIIENFNVQKWVSIKDFFIAVAHHNKFPNDEEFNGRLKQLEVTILDLLRPKTFKDLESIDNIIREGEQNA